MGAAAALGAALWAATNLLLRGQVTKLYAVKLVGAGKTATLNASAPIFGLLGAVVFLHERPSRRNVVGALVAFLGITLVA